MTKARSSGSRALLMLAAFAIAATVGLCANGVADEASDARAGLELAKSVCSPCHVVSQAVGPPFAEIAKGPRAAPEALRDFVHSTGSDVSHPSAMPNPSLTDRQIDEITAYLATLR